MIKETDLYNELKEVVDEKTASKLATIVVSFLEKHKSSDKSADLEKLQEGQRTIQKDINDIKTDLQTLTYVVADIAKTLKETTQIVKELAEAQRRTEQRLEELAEAQKETRRDIGRLDKALLELAEAQRRTEQKVEELAEAQRRTEQRLEELAEAQRGHEERLTKLEAAVNKLTEIQAKHEERLAKLEDTVNKLAEAQAKTEETLQSLIKRVDDIEVQLGGLSAAVGYGLEDRIYPHVPKYIKRIYGIECEELRLRKHLIYEDGRYDELNIFLSGNKNGLKAIALGECKAQPSKKDIDRFMKVVDRVRTYYGIEVYPFVIGYIFNPAVEEYIKEQYPQLRYNMTYEVEHEQY